MTKCSPVDGCVTDFRVWQIRLPFGRKKKQHDAPPVPALAQQQIVEDPTPAVEDDVEAVKTLCGMGFRENWLGFDGSVLRLCLFNLGRIVFKSRYHISVLFSSCIGERLTVYRHYK